ncbi:hypothetical protein JXL21_00050 [Candidatus Bathyarchaeota archaeon]|nr:hypothetical protein [Candidatus Bathyarchaeota archaeon]
MSILYSDDFPVVVIVFRVRGGGSVYLEGEPANRMYIEKRDLQQQVRELIDEGKLALDPEGRNAPALLSIEGGGGFYAALLKGQGHEEARERTSTQSMQPVVVYDEERQAIRLMEENRYHEFNELIDGYRRPTEEPGFTGFDGRTVHPISARTLPNEMRVHSRGRPGRDREKRTVVLLSRGATMADPWSLWEKHPKATAAKFLANALTAAHMNAAVYSYGRDARLVHSPDEVEPTDGENRLDAALREASLLNPERLILITDGKPVTVGGRDAAEECESVMDALNALGMRGVHVLALLLGRDTEMERYYSRLECTPGALVLPLKAGGDIVNTMHGLAAWL